MHPIENILQTTMTEIKQMIDVNTIVGQAVVTPNGCTIIPISKVSFGFVSGGGEYGNASNTNSKKSEEIEFNLNSYPFAGGGAAGISIIPVAFLVAEEDSVKVLTASNKNAFDKLIETAPQIIAEIKHMVGDDKEEDKKS